eukprot:TRINITY_DN11888_c0_g6_i1.p1 TRINITY_DN11888_c0_g6~~TRINITY_DN11888_c0_g6_i1.p1  ORF type:complete len:593 (+),score=134.87 TRINITY_DN11888_c0_g6_i1:3-1781(+)
MRCSLPWLAGATACVGALLLTQLVSGWGAAWGDDGGGHAAGAAGSAPPEAPSVKKPRRSPAAGPQSRRRAVVYYEPAEAPRAEPAPEPARDAAGEPAAPPTAGAPPPTQPVTRQQPQQQQPAADARAPFVEDDYSALGWTPAGPRTTPDGRLRTAWACRELLRSGAVAPLPLPEPHAQQRAAACDSPPRHGIKRLEYDHRRKRKGELDPLAFHGRVRQLADGELPGMALSEGAGADAALGETVNDVPLVDSHGGQHSIFRAWGSKRQWALVYHRDPAQAKRYPQVMAPQPPMWAAGVPNAWTAQGNVFTCDYALSTGACMWETDPGRVAKSPAQYERVFVFCDKQCSGYFHFTHEHLPRLAPLHAALQRDPSVRIMAPEVGFVTSYLVDVLGFNRSRLVRYGSAQGRAVFYPQPQKCGNTFTTTLLLLRRIVFARLRLTAWAPPESGPLVVVLGERSAGPKSRMPQNWDALKDRLAQYYGPRAELVSALGLGVAKQIRLFNRAHVAVGPHGANIANIMWMRHGASVVEFMSYRYGNQCYYITAQRLGLTFRFVLHTEEDKKGQPYDVDFDELRRHVDDSDRRRKGEEPLSFE